MNRKVQIAGGLHERCTYFCFDVQSGSDTDLMPPLDEKEFYLSLYDDLLSTATQSNQVKFSLVQVLYAVKLFAYRVLIWSREAFSFIQPRLNELKTNRPCRLIQDTSIFKTKQQIAIRRRGAEHIVRYGCLIQMFMNALQVLKKMNEDMTKNGIISESFEIQAKEQVP